MKNFTYISLILIFALILSACGGNTNNNAEEIPDYDTVSTATPEQSENQTSDSNSNSQIGSDSDSDLNSEANYESTPNSDISRKIALTFDDGPSAYTDSILDLFEYYGGLATFFVVGPRLVTHQDTLKRTFDLGHEIANHAWTHRDLRTITEREIIEEIESTSNAIISIVGTSPPIFRPPFGASDERVEAITAELGYAIVKWTLDPLDWRYRDADVIYDTIMSRVENGDILLFHDTRPTTAEAMRRLIPSLIAEGFELVTVSELLYYLYGGPTAGVIYGWYTDL